jgi:hypothetical protein
MSETIQKYQLKGKRPGDEKRNAVSTILVFA